MDIAHYDNKAWLHRVVTFKALTSTSCPQNRLTFFSITPLNDYMSTERVYDGSIPSSTHWADKKIEADSMFQKPRAIVRTNVQNGPLINAVTGIGYLNGGQYKTIYLKLFSLNPERDTPMDVVLGWNSFCDPISDCATYSGGPDYQQYWTSAHAMQIEDIMQITHDAGFENESRIIILMSDKHVGLQQFIIDFGYACTNTACSNTEKPMLKPISQKTGYTLKFIGM